MSAYCDNRGSFGKLSRAQEAIVRRFVTGRAVHDLGAGDFFLSRCLIDLGARRVFAVERQARHSGILEAGSPYEAVQVVGAGFRALGKVARHHRRVQDPLPAAWTPDVAFVSWPTPEDSKFTSHSDYSLLAFVRRAKVVIYLGSNLDGTMCGSRKLYEHLGRREVLAHEPDRRNTLIVYGRLLPRGRGRELLPEERAGIDTTQIYRFRDVYPTVTADDVLGRTS
jgi:hypothetical protein